VALAAFWTKFVENAQLFFNLAFIIVQFYQKINRKKGKNELFW
jgi:NhaP-type Na+/H+ and K+/H+ antiporter